jgi:hypothetical protein
MTAISRYFLSAPTGKTSFLDLRLSAAEALLYEQQSTVMGSAQVDWVYAGVGTSVDFTDSGAGVDRLCLDGRLADYKLSVTGSVLTLSRTVGVQTFTYKVNTSEDRVVFANGSTTAANLAANASAPSGVVLNTAETSATVPVRESVVKTQSTHVTLNSGGALFAAAGGPQLVIQGTTGVESVYVRAGADVDARNLGGGTDKVYLAGQWADYSKTLGVGIITFTRTVADLTERVIVASGLGVANDQLYFADGSIQSEAARVALSRSLVVSLKGAGGLVTTSASNKTPVILAVAIISAISADSGASETDFITKDAAQTVTGTFTGQLALGDKIQVRVGTGSWKDASVSGVTASGGNFSVAGVNLAEGVNALQVRTLSANGNTRTGTGQSVTLDTGLPEGSLSIGVGQDNIVNSNETGITLRVTGTSKLKVGDKLRLKIGDANIASVPEVEVTEAMKSAGVSFTVPKSALAEGLNTFTLVGTDKAGNTSTSAGLKVQSVWSYVQVNGSLYAGPVMEGNDLVVTAYDAVGNILAQDTSVEAGTGRYSLKIFSSYRGPVLIKVSSAGPQGDYRDEGTGQATDLQGNVFYAVSTATSSEVTANVTPLTDVAAKKLMTGERLSAGVGNSHVQNANAVVSKLFLGQDNADITQLAVTPTLNADGTANSSSANLYGQVLEQISKQATAGKTFADVQADLVAGVNWSKDAATTTAALNNNSAAAQAQVLAKVQYNVQNTAGAKLGITQEDLTKLGMEGVQGLSAEGQQARLVAINAMLQDFPPEKVNTTHKLIALVNAYGAVMNDLHAGHIPDKSDLALLDVDISAWPRQEQEIFLSALADAYSQGAVTSWAALHAGYQSVLNLNVVYASAKESAQAVVGDGTAQNPVDIDTAVQGSASNAIIIALNDGEHRTSGVLVQGGRQLVGGGGTLSLEFGAGVKVHASLSGEPTVVVGTSAYQGVVAWRPGSAATGIQAKGGVLSLGLMGEVADVFLQSGQSNSVGYESTTNYPAKYDKQSQFGKIWSSTQTFWDLTSTTAGGINTDTKVDDSANGFGFTNSIAENLDAALGTDYYIVKIGRGGKSITNWLSDGTYDEQMVEQTLNAVNYLASSGKVPMINNFIWLQGEKDIASNATYEANFFDFVNSLNQRLGLTLDTTVISLRQWTADANIPGLIHAQKLVAAKNRNITYVSTEDLRQAGELNTDVIHYGPDNYFTIGDRVFQALDIQSDRVTAINRLVGKLTATAHSAESVVALSDYQQAGFSDVTASRVPSVTQVLRSALEREPQMALRRMVELVLNQQKAVQTLLTSSAELGASLTLWSMAGFADQVTDANVQAVRAHLGDSSVLQGENKLQAAINAGNAAIAALNTIRTGPGSLTVQALLDVGMALPTGVSLASAQAALKATTSVIDSVADVVQLINPHGLYNLVFSPLQNSNTPAYMVSGKTVLPAGQTLTLSNGAGVTVSVPVAADGSFVAMFSPQVTLGQTDFTIVSGTTTVGTAGAYTGLTGLLFNNNTTESGGWASEVVNGTQKFEGTLNTPQRLESITFWAPSNVGTNDFNGAVLYLLDASGVQINLSALAAQNPSRLKAVGNGLKIIGSATITIQLGAGVGVVGKIELNGQVDADGNGTPDHTSTYLGFTELDVVPFENSDFEISSQGQILYQRTLTTESPNTADKTFQQAQQLLQNIYAGLGVKALAGRGVTEVSLIDFHNAGLANVTSDNLQGVLNVWANHVFKDNSMATLATAVPMVTAALARIEAYNNGDGQTPAAPTASDYLFAGVSGVTVANLLAVNRAVLGAATGGADTAHEIQALVAQANAALAKVQAYADGDGTTPAALQVSDYQALGLSQVTPAKLAAMNAAVLAKGAGEVDTIPEIAALVPDSVIVLSAERSSANNDVRYTLSGVASSNYAGRPLTVSNGSKSAQTTVNADGTWTAVLADANTLGESGLTVTAGTGGNPLDSFNGIGAELYDNVVNAAAGFAQAVVGNVQRFDASLKSPQALESVTFHQMTANTSVLLGGAVFYAFDGSGNPLNLSALAGQNPTRLVAVGNGLQIVGNGTVTIKLGASLGAIGQIRLDGQVDADGNGTPEHTGTFLGFSELDVVTVPSASASMQVSVTDGSTPASATYQDPDFSQSANAQALLVAANLNKIDLFADGDGNNPGPLSVEVYRLAGVLGVHAENIDAVNAQVLAAATNAADTVAEVQALVSAANAALGVVRAYAAGNGSTPAPLTVAQYEAVGLKNVSNDNLAQVNDFVLGHPVSADRLHQADTFAYRVTEAIGTILNHQETLNTVAPLLEDYALAGVMGVNASNLEGVNTQLGKRLSVVTSLADVAALVTKTNTALSDIEAYNNGDGQTPVAPTASDYLFAGVSGVTVDNLLAVNRAVLCASPGGADTAHEIRALVTQANAALAKVQAYADGDGTTPAALQVSDYQALGLSQVTPAKLTAMNAAVLVKGAGEVDTVPEIAALVPNMEVNAYSLAVSGLTPVGGAPSLANGTYQRVSQQELANLHFGDGYAPQGQALVDTTKPVYSYTDAQGGVWYAWARQGSGYHISKLDNTGEWYWEASANNTFANSPSEVGSLGNAWRLSDAPASQVVQSGGHVYSQNSVTVAERWLSTQGNDSLSGGAGADIFAFMSGETSHDTITDFNKTEGDKLDLRQLLQGSGLNLSLEGSVNQYLQLTQSGHDAVLKIRVTGDGAFAQAVQTITMTNGWSSGGMNADLMALLSNQVILA